MLKYLIIPLSDDAVSFCHYCPGNMSKPITPALLKDGIKWAMKENLSIQFVYPYSILSQDILELIDEVDHIDIVPSNSTSLVHRENADIVVFDQWEEFKKFHFVCGQSYVIRTSLSDLLDNEPYFKTALTTADRINVALADIQNIGDNDMKKYNAFLSRLIQPILEEYKSGHQVQLNLLTDRLMLRDMNNCNAGYESITLAPDGKFYTCPAFYLSGFESIGDVNKGLNRKNEQLYKLSYAPICRNCDAFQCKRCVWLNKNLTHEINTPSHEQCVVSHMERNASRNLLLAFREIDPTFLHDVEIAHIDYLDPFEKLINKK